MPSLLLAVVVGVNVLAHSDSKHSRVCCGLVAMFVMTVVAFFFCSMYLFCCRHRFLFLFLFLFVIGIGMLGIPTSCCVHVVYHAVSQSVHSRDTG